MEKQIFGVDYCLCMIAHPDYYRSHCGWNPESDEEAGEYKEYRERTIRYFWSTSAPYVPMVGTMPISERAKNPKLEYIYAPYMIQQWDEEAKQKQDNKKEDSGSYINNLDSGVMASHLYNHLVEGD